VAEGRNAAVPELRILLLESESESIVGGSEVVYVTEEEGIEERTGTRLRVAGLDYTRTG